MNQMGLGIMFSARDMASGPIGLLRRNFSGLHQSVMSGMGRILAGFAAVAAGAALLTTGLNTLRGAFDLAVEAGRFGTTLEAVGVISRATAQDMELLRRSAIDAGIATQFSPDQAVEGLQSLAAAGQNATAATETLIPVLNLATGSLGQLGVAQAAEAVVGSLNAYGMAASDAVGVTDQLLRATQLSNFQARDFSVGLSRAAATGAQYGQSLSEQLILMGLLRNMNIEASVASTSLREAQRRLFTDQRALQNLQRLRIDAFDEETGQFRQALDVMREFAEATADLTDRERSRLVTQTFGIRGMAAYNAVAQANVEVSTAMGRETLRGAAAIEHLRTEMASAAGTAEEFSERRLATFEGRMVLLQGTMQTLKVTIGDTFGNVFAPAVTAVTEATNMFIRGWTGLPRGLTTAVAGIVIGASAFMIFSGVILIVVGVLTLLVTLLGSTLLIIGAITAAIILSMAPILLWVAALAGLATLFDRAVASDLGGFGTWVRGMLRQGRLLRDGLVQLFTDGAFSGAVLKEMERAENQGIMKFVITLYMLGTRLQKMWIGVQQGFEAAWAEMGPAFAELRIELGALWADIQAMFGADGAMVEGAANIPVDEYVSAGVEIGRAIGGTLKFIAQVIRVVVEGFRLLVQYLTWVGNSPVFRALRAVGGAVFGAAGGGRRGGGESWWGVGRERGFGAVTGAMLARRRGAVAAAQMRAIATERQRAKVGRPEPGIKATRVVGAGMGGEEFAWNIPTIGVGAGVGIAPQQRQRRRPQPIDLRLQTTVQVDDRVLGETVERRRIEQGAAEGVVGAGEGG